MEENLRWKITFDRRQHLVEHILWWKTTIAGRQTLSEEDLWWKMTFKDSETSAWWSWPKFCYVYVYGEEEEGEFNQRAKQKNVKPQHPEILLVGWIEEEFLSQKVIIAPNFRWKWLPFYVDFGSRTVGSALQAVTQALQLVSGCPGCPHPCIWIKL